MLPRLAALLVVVLGLSGCLAIKSETASTRLPGVVTLDVSICVSNRVDGSQCIPNPVDAPLRANTAEADDGQDPAAGSEGLTFQLLIGLRVPDGTVAPAEFRSTHGEVFTKSPSYTTDLSTDRAAPAGFHWEGYISSSVMLQPGEPVTVLNPELTLPAGPNGAPFAGPFQWRALVGARLVGNADDPVTCGAMGDDCYESPPAGDLFGQLSQPVSDFRVLPGAGATAAPGQTATVAFPVRYVDGAGFGAQTLHLSATSGLPGSPAVTPAAPTLSIAAGATPTASVSVTVPAGTAPGSYPVTLTAADGATDPVVRTGAATVTVVDRTAPAIAIGSPTDGETLTVGQRIAAAYSCADEANGSGLASCTGPVAAGAPLDTATPGPKTFTVTASDRAGNAASLTHTYIVVAPPPPTVNASVSFAFARAHGGLRFTSLLVKDVPRGATVTARLRHGRRFVKRNAHGTVALRRFEHRTLKRGTRLTVSVTKAGAIGRIKTLVVNRTGVTVTTTCLPPGAKTPRRCTT
jgi:hypothetical protein